MRHDSTRLVRTARCARNQLETHVVNKRLLATIYKAYNPAIRDIDHFVQRAVQLFPVLNCGLATVYLKHLLGEGQVIQASYQQVGHTYLRLNDIIIDITADQFGGPKVYIGSPNSAYS